jgi:hypothetical protein
MVGFQGRGGERKRRLKVKRGVLCKERSPPFQSWKGWWRQEKSIESFSFQLGSEYDVYVYAHANRPVRNVSRILNTWSMNVLIFIYTFFFEINIYLYLILQIKLSY